MKKSCKKKAKMLYYKVLCVLLNPKNKESNPYEGSPIKGWLTHLVPGNKKSAAWILISGEVTGVGFRNWLRKKAKDKGLEYQVRNKNNKTVEALLIGSGANIEAVIRASWEGPKNAKVKSIKEYWFNQPTEDGIDNVESPTSFQKKVERGCDKKANVFKKAFSSTELIKNEFNRLGYKTMYMGNYLIVIVNKEQIIFKGCCSSLESSVWVKMLSNKVVSREIFENVGVHIAKGKYFSQDDKAGAKAFALSLPSCVVKPRHGHQGKGITVGVKDSATFDHAWNVAVNKRGVIIEEEFKGNDARYLVVGGKCVAVTKRIPPQVIGNGIDTVEELINKKNHERKQTPVYSKLLIKLDAHRLSIIKNQGFELSSIPSKGEIVYIDWKANVCAGADPCDLTDEVHPLFKKIAEKVAASIPGVYSVGVDIMAYDHTKKPNRKDYIVIEANTQPGIFVHHYPTYGQPRNVARDIVEYTLKMHSARSKNQTASINNYNMALPNGEKGYDKIELNVSETKNQCISERKGCYEEKAEALSKKLIVNEFEALGYSCELIDEYTVVSIGDEKIFFSGTESSLTSYLGVKIIKDRAMARRFFEKAGVSIAKGKCFDRRDKETARKFALSLSLCVIQPSNGRKGEGVTIGLKDPKEFDYAWDIAVKNSKKGILIEEEFKGVEARYLVVGGKCIAVTKRIPPQVIGNGIDTVEELINKKNHERSLNPLFCSQLIILDDHRLSIIKNQGFELSSIPAEGEQVFFDWKANYCAGADTCDLTDEVHPLYKRVAEKAAMSIPGLDVVGVDIMAHDFAKEPGPNNYIVIEANSRPMILIHHYPMYGKPRNVARAIVEHTINACNHD